ncbi:MAG: lysophospholipid acyltransferase family protein [Cardiobacteriaceae bacterium]|nr:lysophospholipid acyltransferase family protein [Cardiobacteriaceae bacterium]
MNPIRFYGFKFLFVIVTLLWSSAIGLTSYFLPERKHVIFASYWGDTVIWLAKVVAGIDYRLTGEEHIPKILAGQSAFVLMSNHQSTWETAFLPTLNRYQVWVLKQELAKIPVFGWALTRLGSIAIDREQKKAALKQVMQDGKSALERGRSVSIFPEGTRSPVDAPQKFLAGGAMLAHHAGVVIVPVAHNAGMFWSSTGKLHQGTIEVVVGEPIATEGKSLSQVQQEAEAWISQTRERLIAEEYARRQKAL